MTSNSSILSDFAKRLQNLQSGLMEDEKLLKRAQQDHKQACLALNKRLNNIYRINSKIYDLNNDLVLEAIYLNTDKQKRSDAYLYWLKFGLGMHMYYQNQEKERVKTTINEFIKARRYWFIQKKRLQILNDLYMQYKHAVRIEIGELETKYVY
jgi:ABC-type phosphate transport system auxiliary subunit